MKSILVVLIVLTTLFSQKVRKVGIITGFGLSSMPNERSHDPNPTINLGVMYKNGKFALSTIYEVKSFDVEEVDHLTRNWTYITISPRYHVPIGKSNMIVGLSFGFLMSSKVEYGVVGESIRSNRIDYTDKTYGLRPSVILGLNKNVTDKVELMTFIDLAPFGYGHKSQIVHTFNISAFFDLGLR